MAVIEVPEVSGKELATLVPIEARKYIPGPINEVMLDWSVIPKTEEKPEDEEGSQSSGFAGQTRAPGVSRVDVLLVAIHNETIAKYQEIVTRSGLDAGFFEIEIFSTMRSVLDEGLRPVMIMDMGAASTKLYIVERGIIRASHTVNRGSQDI